MAAKAKQGIAPFTRMRVRNAAWGALDQCGDIDLRENFPDPYDFPRFRFPKATLGPSPYRGRGRRRPRKVPGNFLWN